MTRPNIHNLRKRAKALGLVITKGTTEQEAREFGENQYVLHPPLDNPDHCELYTLYGIRRLIEDKENS